MTIQDQDGKLVIGVVKNGKTKDLLTEGVLDRILTVFLAGFGSGKSFVAGEIFGIPKKVNVSALV